jgi:HlyD family secretion protein
MKAIFSTLILLSLLAAGGYYYVKYGRSEGTNGFRTQPIERGNMLPTIEATGSLEPEQVVDIGSQVNGLITSLKADYGSNVEKDEILATVDKTLYQATVDSNQALVKSASANLELAKANLSLAEANLNRDKTLLQTKGALAPSQYDTDLAAVKVQTANVAVEEAAINQTQATLRQSQVNLGYCDIKSPVKGTIVDRRVNEGQTVVSSLSASSLFLLAKDLSRIQVWASVNEADIGRIHKDLPVHFKVDAYPNETFEGKVQQIRLNATMTQNVVTYTVVVTTDNKDMKLLPYMTASLLFEIERHENVLKVPNAALRWKPQPKQIAPEIRSETLKAMNSKQADDNEEGGDKPAAEGGQDSTPQPKPDDAASPATPGSAPAASGGTATGTLPEDWKARMEKKAESVKKAAADKKAMTDKKAAADKKTGAGQAAGRNDGKLPQGVKPLAGKGQAPGRPISPAEAKKLKGHHESGRLWIVDGNYVRPIPVKIIATDGTMTEVRGKDINEGMEVVIGVNLAAENEADTTNPFMPKFRGNSKSSGNSK